MSNLSCIRAQLLGSPENPTNVFQNRKIFEDFLNSSNDTYELFLWPKEEKSTLMKRLLLKELQRLNFPHKEVIGDFDEVTALFYHDPSLLKKPIREIDLHVMTTDVTHGIFLDRCGFTKLSMFCYIDEGRHIRPIG
jgi:hypothetical protein